MARRGRVIGSENQPDQAGRQALTTRLNASSRRRPWPWLLVLGIVALAVGARLYLILTSGALMDGDEALVGLQALHILRDGERPVFFYGQSYMGSLEAYLAAAVFAVWGPSALALRAVPLTFAACLVVITYALAQRLGDRVSATVAALCAACPALYVAVWTVKARGGFVETLFLGLLLLLLTCSLVERQGGLGRWLALGVLAGLAFWVSGMIVYYLLACAPFLLWSAARAPRWGTRGLIVATLGAVVGAAPLVVYNARHGLATLAYLFGGAPGHAAQTLRQAPAVLGYFVRACLPELTGVWQPYTPSWAPWGAALLALYAVGALCLAARAVRPRRVLPLLVLTQAALVPLVFAASGFGGASLNPYGFDATGRYTLPLAALLPLAMAALTQRVLVVSAPAWRGLLATALVGLVVGGSALQYARADKSLIFQSEYWHRLPMDSTPLVNCLDHLGVRDLWMNHWASYPLMFATQERFVAADYNDVALNGGVNRLPWTLRQVGRAPRPAYVLVVGDAGVTPLQRRLDALGVTYQRCVALPYQVLRPTSRRVDPREVAATIGYAY